MNHLPLYFEVLMYWQMARDEEYSIFKFDLDFLALFY